MSISQLLTTREAAELLRVSSRTLEGWRVTGGGPSFFKPGSRVVYDRLELEEWLYASRRTTTSDLGLEAA